MDRNAESTAPVAGPSGIRRPKKESSSSGEDHNKVGDSALPPQHSGENSEEDIDSDELSDLMKKSLKLTKTQKKVLSRTTIDGVAKFIKKNPNLKIITMVGAGISTGAGIPDFRTPGTGLYDNLQKYNLPYPTAIFELRYFKRNPEPFFHLAREMFPNDTYLPTKAHFFVRLLQNKRLLSRHYTQNIDNLDRSAGIIEDKLIEAHGTFHTSHCMKCNTEYDFQWFKDNIKHNNVLKCSKCEGLVKPDIVFFGEKLPTKFHTNICSDFKACELLIIMGSSLIVEPFASLVRKVGKHCPRLMINANPAGEDLGLKFNKPDNGRDVLWLGNCDEGCQLLAQKLGWETELEELFNSSRVSK